MRFPLYLKAIILLCISFALFSFILESGKEEIPSQNNLNSTGITEKKVKVDLSLQRAFLLENDKIVKEYVISSGKPSTPTPTGTFKVIHKQDMVYSKIAGCWLGFWVGFTLDGDYGFHETPICDGQRQGEAEIGTPVSAGCIRLKLADAEEFYGWVGINTPIEIK